MENLILEAINYVSKISRQKITVESISTFLNKKGPTNINDQFITETLKDMQSKGPDKPSCIDLILTNCSRSFQNSCAIETGLSDFHKLVVTVLKTTYKKSKPKIITYRNYKSFNNDGFRNALQQIECNADNCDTNFEKFMSSCSKILDQQAPQKKRYVRGNQSPFMNETLTKAIMHRSKLRNKFLKKRTEENRRNYTKQRNLFECFECSGSYLK